MLPRVPAPGDVVADKYEITRPLGQGGMGVVFEARHKKLGNRVAIKFLLPEGTADPESVKRFDREARAAALIRSPYVVRVHDVDATADGLPFIVMEYVEGTDLMSELRKRDRVSPAEAVDWVLHACAGLADAHARGILHRDVKPSNLYLCREATGPVVKVMDFGVSKIVAASHVQTALTDADTAVGTTSYMAPEQLIASRAVDHRADVWSLGVVLYRMLSGTLPFREANPTATAIAIATTPAPSLSEVAPWVPAELAAAVMGALASEAADRYPDMMTFGRAIQRWGSGRFSFEGAIRGVPSPPVAGPARSPMGSAPALGSAPARSDAAPGAPLAPVPPAAAARAAESRTMTAPFPQKAEAEPAPKTTTATAAGVVVAVALLFVASVVAVALLVRGRDAGVVTPVHQEGGAVALPETSTPTGAFAPPPRVPEPVAAEGTGVVVEPLPSSALPSSPSSALAAPRGPLPSRSAGPPKPHAPSSASATAKPPPKPEDPLHL